jgi:iron-sulfur cluster assembly accessory protein
MIELTDAAISKALERTSDSDGSNIRIGLTSGGCVGFEYTFSYDNKILEDDWVGDFGKFKILIDKTSQPYIKGSTLDWIKDGFQEYFKLNNPQEVSACGCGVSVQF